MKITELPLKGAYTIDLEIQEDNRGFFARYFCKKEFEKYGLSTHWVQINTSLSQKKGTFRGLHYQNPPMAEVKVVRCLRGAIWDVIVDMRANSPTYGEWYGKNLNEENRTMIYVPEGFAHGFQTLTDNVEQLYLHSEFYSPDHEGGLRHDDPTLKIQCPLPISEISIQDQNHPLLAQLTPIMV